jgi:hypothetical protein
LQSNENHRGENQMPNFIHLDVVAFQDSNGFWIAQCIQHDITARAKSILEVRRAFARQLKANLVLNERMGRNGLDGIPSAPEKFKRAFDAAEEHMTRSGAFDEIGLYIPPGQIDIRLAEAA